MSCICSACRTGRQCYHLIFRRKFFSSCILRLFINAFQKLLPFRYIIPLGSINIFVICIYCKKRSCFQVQHPVRQINFPSCIFPKKCLITIFFQITEHFSCLHMMPHKYHIWICKLPIILPVQKDTSGYLRISKCILIQIFKIVLSLNYWIVDSCMIHNDPSTYIRIHSHKLTEIIRKSFCLVWFIFHHRFQCIFRAI